MAQSCLYGVDCNPVAVDLAKMSLWLSTLARNHPLTFLDHALKHGDSLVGLSIAQIEGFHWERKKAAERQGFVSLKTREHIECARGLRARIQVAGGDALEAELSKLLRDADSELDQVRLAGDLVVGAFFSGSTSRERESRLATLGDAFGLGMAGDHRYVLGHSGRSLRPFHWELEFPEVFRRKLAGFDCMVGNPPFLGGSIISRALGDSYRPFLHSTYTQGEPGRIDLVVYFLLHAVELSRPGGLAGFLVTSSALEGDARRVLGLCLGRSHGQLTRVGPKRPWPGEAAVYYRTVSLARSLEGQEKHRVELGRQPARLAANAGLAWRGTEVRGEGFIITDEERVRLLSEDSANARVISEYMNGKDLNSRPDMSPGRWIINFGTMDLREAEQYSQPFALVTERVRPFRATRTKQVHEPDYWKFWDKRLESYARLETLGRCLALSAVTSSETLAWVRSGPVFQNKLVLILTASDAAFAILQSNVHWLWVRANTASRGPTGINYSPSQCFETFPFTTGWESNPVLEQVGQDYHEFRARLMVRNNEGLTKTYNRFHDPGEDSPDILRLRDLHEVTDRAVLDAYGWEDIPTACEFLLDYEEDEEEAGSKKRPWRYRWPDDVRDEVLARLLELNAQRAAEEALAGAAANRRGGGRRSSSRERNLNAESLF